MNKNTPAGLLTYYLHWKVILRFAGIALLIRLIILGYFVYQSNHLFPDKMIAGFILEMNDYGYFLGTVDNYCETGTMIYDNQVKPFAGRMPGYGFPYLLIRMFTDRLAGLVILMSFQILLAALATSLLAMISLIVFKDKRIFLAVFWCYAIAAPTIIFDIFTLSESFSISAIICFFYFLGRFFLDNKNKHLFFAGFFLAWAIFLRPFLGTLILITPLFLFICLIKRETFMQVVSKVMLFCLPFILFESTWIARNFMVLGRFIPLETSLSESYGEDGLYRTSAMGIRTLVNSWGGEVGEFYDGSEGWWFHVAQGKESTDFVFQPYVFNAGFTRDSLVALKFIFNQSVNMELDKPTRQSYNMEANRIALRYAADYKANNPLRFYFINPFKMYGKLLFSNGTRLLMMPAISQMNLIEKGIKLFYLVFYFGFIFAGFIGMFLFLWQRIFTTEIALLLLVYPWIISTTLVFYASFVIIEYRYLISAFPVFILFAIFGFYNLPWIKRKPIS